MKAYAGIGSRKAPPDVLGEMYMIAVTLARLGYVLRSGGAEGCDTACESGADAAQGAKQIFRPKNVPDWAYVEVQKHLPAGYAWHAMRPFVKALLARDMQQVLGEHGNAPSEFVVCWTPDGLDSGGTGYAIRCARAHSIDVYNIRNK